MVENKPLVLDMLEWIAEKPRSYDEVMSAWRTSCPRLPVWEDAVDMRFVSRTRDAEGNLSVVITPGGLAFLRSERPVPVNAAAEARPATAADTRAG